MSDPHDPLVVALQEGRRQFLERVAEIRPELHRYCARMVGSVAEGEDVVQETLARAYYALSEVTVVPPLRPWLFQIAHNRALDHLRHHAVRDARPLELVEDTAADAGPSAEDLLARDEAVRAALSRFLELVPAQRSCVILKDVLGHSAEEIGALLGLSVPAVKAALHRGRERLKSLSAQPAPEPPTPRAVSPGLARYATLFNARDWDGVRALLAEDVRLDLVTKSQRSGRQSVGVYFTNYASMPGWRVVPAWLEGREVLAVHARPGDARPTYFVELTLTGDGQVSLIRDFRYVPYIADDAAFTPAASGPARAE